MDWDNILAYLKLSEEPKQHAVEAIEVESELIDEGKIIETKISI